MGDRKTSNKNYGYTALHFGVINDWLIDCLIDCNDDCLCVFVGRRSHCDQKLSKYVADLHAFINLRLNDLYYLLFTV